MDIDDRFYSMRGIKGKKTIIPPDVGTLVAIAFSHTPSQTTYTEGVDSIPLSEFKVIARFSGGAEIDVTDSCTYIVNDPVQWGDTYLTVVYETESLTWNYTVIGVPVPAPADTIMLCHLDGNYIDEVTSENCKSGSNVNIYSNGYFNQCAGYSGYSGIGLPSRALPRYTRHCGRYKPKYYSKCVYQSV